MFVSHFTKSLSLTDLSSSSSNPITLSSFWSQTQRDSRFCIDNGGPNLRFDIFRGSCLRFFSYCSSNLSLALSFASRIALRAFGFLSFGYKLRFCGCFIVGFLILGINTHLGFGINCGISDLDLCFVCNSVHIFFRFHPSWSGSRRSLVGRPVDLCFVRDCPHLEFHRFYNFRFWLHWCWVDSFAKLFHLVGLVLLLSLFRFGVRFCWNHSPIMMKN